MSSLVLYEVKDRTGYITLNRPEKRNALSFEFVNEIKSVFKKAKDDADCKVIVIKAKGEAFCAGADLSYLQQLQKNTDEENKADSNHLAELFRMIYLCPKVVISQITGAALAGGCGLATVCDFSFATPDSTFAYTEVKIGFVPAIVMIFLLRKVNGQTARKLMLTGDIINSETALNYGLIDFVSEANTIEEDVNKFAAKICKQSSSQSISTIKKMLSEAPDLSFEEGLDYSVNMNVKARKTDDCKKGIAAFLNKEKLSW